jgi:transketolase
VGVHSFGASAPFKEVFQRFGIVAETVVEAARTVLRPAE